MSLDINISCLNIKSGKEVCSKSSTFVTRFSAIPLPMLPRPMNPTVLLVLANGDFKNVFIYCTAIKPEYCLTALAAMKGVHIFDVQAILSQAPDHFSRL